MIAGDQSTQQAPRTCTPTRPASRRPRGRLPARRPDRVVQRQPDHRLGPAAAADPGQRRRPGDDRRRARRRSCTRCDQHDGLAASPTRPTRDQIVQVGFLGVVARRTVRERQGPGYVVTTMATAPGRPCKAHRHTAAEALPRRPGGARPRGARPERPDERRRRQPGRRRGRLAHDRSPSATGSSPAAAARRAQPVPRAVQPRAAAAARRRPHRRRALRGGPPRDRPAAAAARPRVRRHRQAAAGRLRDGGCHPGGERAARSTPTSSIRSRSADRAEHPRRPRSEGHR